MRPLHSGFTRALESDPTNIKALRGAAKVALSSDNPQQAVGYLSRAIQAGDSSAFTYADRGRAYSMLANHPAALSDLEYAVERAPDDPWMRYDRGRLYLRRGAFQAAVDDLSLVITQMPELFLASVYRAHAYRNLGDSASAIEDYERARTLQPGYAGIDAPLAVLYFDQERFLDAATIFQTQWERPSISAQRDPALLFATVISYRMAGEREQAEQFLRREVRHVAQDSGWYDLARFYGRPVDDTTITTVISSSRDPSFRTRATFYLGAQYEVSGSLSSARTAYRTIADDQDYGLSEQCMARARLSRMGLR